MIRLQGSQQFLGEFFDNPLVVAEVKQAPLESICQFGLLVHVQLMKCLRRAKEGHGAIVVAGTTQV